MVSILYQFVSNRLKQLSMKLLQLVKKKAKKKRRRLNIMK